MQGYEITLNIYAENEAEAESARKSLIGFISEHAKHGRAVTGKKICTAVSRWDKNPLIKRKIIDFLK